MRIAAILAVCSALLVGCASGPVDLASGQSSATAPPELAAGRRPTSGPIAAMVPHGCPIEAACAPGFAIGETIYESAGVDLVDSSVGPDDHAAGYGAAGRTIARPLVGVPVDVAVGLRAEGAATWTLALAATVDLDAARSIICEHGDLTPAQRAADGC